MLPGLRQGSRTRRARRRCCGSTSHGLDLPAAAGNGEVTWRGRAMPPIRQIVTNPIYGGASAYRSTWACAISDRPPTAATVKAAEAMVHTEAQRAKVISTGSVRRRSAGWWRELSDKPASPGAPEHGDALLAGLVRCHHCGRKLTVASRYEGTTFHAMPVIEVFSTMAGTVHRLGGLRVDDAIEAALLQFVAPPRYGERLRRARAATRRDQVRGAAA